MSAEAPEPSAVSQEVPEAETRRFWCTFHFSWHKVRATTVTLPNDGTECVMAHERKR